MGDTTEAKLRQTLSQPDEAATAGRRTFVAIIWSSVALSFAAHVAEASGVVPVLLAAALITMLGCWLHAVFRIHDGDTTTRRTVALMLGATAIFVALVSIDSAYLGVLFGLFTLVFVWTADDRTAMGLSLIVTLCWVGAWLYHDLPTGALATPFLVWITLVAIQQVQSRVASQSASRRDLLEEIQRTRTQLKDEQRRRGALEERERVAGEIHDTLAQGFTSIVLLSEATHARIHSLPTPQVAETLALVEQVARDNLVAARRLVEARPPAELEGRSLIQALQVTAASFESRTGIDCSVTTQADLSDLHLRHAEVAAALVRVTQEALANAAKYAHPSCVSIEAGIDEVDGSVQLMITDDGIGFDTADGPTPIAGGTGGHGIALMRKRLAALDGELRVQSSPGHGTTVSAAVPAS